MGGHALRVSLLACSAAECCRMLPEDDRLCTLQVLHEVRWEGEWGGNVAGWYTQCISMLGGLAGAEGC